MQRIDAVRHIIYALLIGSTRRYKHRWARRGYGMTEMASI